MTLLRRTLTGANQTGPTLTTRIAKGKRLTFVSVEKPAGTGPVQFRWQLSTDDSIVLLMTGWVRGGVFTASGAKSRVLDIKIDDNSTEHFFGFRNDTGSTQSVTFDWIEARL